MAKKDSLLAHCLARAVIHEQGGLEAAAAKYGPKAERLSKWRATATAVKVTPKGLAGCGLHRPVGDGDAGRGAGFVLDHGVPAVLERERAPGVPAAGGVPGAMAGVRDAERVGRQIVAYLRKRREAKETSRRLS